MQESKSDFTKVKQKQWQENQSKEEIERLQDTLRAKDRKIEELSNELMGKDGAIKQFEIQLKTAQEEKEKIIKEKNLQIQEKNEVINNIKREISSLRMALDKEKNKSLIEFIKAKMKKGS